MKICMIFVPVFAGHLYGMDDPESEMIFIFQKVKPTWHQPDLSSVCMAACLLKHKLCQPAWWQTRSGWSHYKAWLAEDSLSGYRAAWCREELQGNIAYVCFVWKWKKLKNLFKCPLVNETLWPETETRRLKNTSRDRLETETSRPRLQLWCIVCIVHNTVLFLGVASMRQDEAIASSSCNCVLISSVKSNLNTAPNTPFWSQIIKKLFLGSGSSPLPRPFLRRGGDPLSAPHSCRRLGRLN